MLSEENRQGLISCLEEQIPGASISFSRENTSILVVTGRIEYKRPSTSSAAIPHLGEQPLIEIIQRGVNPFGLEIRAEWTNPEEVRYSIFPKNYSL